MLNNRDSLQQFITEQIIGPGSCGFRFVEVNDKILEEDLTELEPIKYTNELINIAPAMIYSSGILFPLNESNGIVSEKTLVEIENSTSEDEEQEINEIIDLEQDSAPIDQMYPNSMGISCCYSSKLLDHKQETISIGVRARYYTNFKCDTEEFNNRFGILCECDKESLEQFIVYHNMPYFKFNKIGPNDIIMIDKISSEQKTILKIKLRDVNRSSALTLSKEIPWLKEKENLSSLKQTIYYELKKNDKLDNEQRQNLYVLSQKVEKIENMIFHLRDILDINDSRSYGLWKSEEILQKVEFPISKISSLERRKIFSFTNKENGLNDVYLRTVEEDLKASLSLNLQFSTDVRAKKDNIFLKIQLVNTSTPFKRKSTDSRYFSTANEIVNKTTFFGVKIFVEDDNLTPFNSYMPDEKQSFDEDEVTKYIYRQFKDYGIGHNCSVKWSKNSDGVVKVESDYLPVAESPEIEPVPKNSTKFKASGGCYEPEPLLKSTQILEFKEISTFSSLADQEIIVGLLDFVNAYKSWIAKKSKKDSTENIRIQELGKCLLDCSRMSENIQLLLENNSENMRSFRLMNSVMFMQLWHSVKGKKNEVIQFFDNESFAAFNKEFYTDANDQLFQPGVHAAWRAFQLAFILLNLDGIFHRPDDLGWKKRNDLVDLIWFPTGGGKTEAYLGLIALTIINRRRLYGQAGGGTAVIMRYTLRLLTLQQFQRATLMIMALELLRRWGDEKLGDEPIYIGLWVGDDLMPNKLDDLLKEYQRFAERNTSAIPFEVCPWCGSVLTPAQSITNDKRDVYKFNRLFLKCGNKKCSFYYTIPGLARPDQGPIPVSLCDEEIYQHPPALLFGTVDKFAQLAHKVSNKNDHRHLDSRRLFGRGNWEHGKPSGGYLPPDLIIQDELHLLLGPLGSAVALFESVIDQLCRRDDGTRSKIISSTATTRNTALQIMALFDRMVNIFPKSGVDCDDSFFAFYKRASSDHNGQDSKYLSKRKYIGFLPTGRTQIWMQMRLVSILLTHRALFELKCRCKDDNLEFTPDDSILKSIDHFHSIVSYFNSLKDVGRTESQIFTYLLKEVRRVFNRVIRPQKLIHCLYTYSIDKSELTGRRTGIEIKKELQRIQNSWNPVNRIAPWGESESKENPPDFIVATNMISVGIDISRLNLMVMNSMPRNISEYIQASSRVARDSSGLVLTVHHPFRTRDVSHYERFQEFHEKMYSYVEPISITPFTKKAINRYLSLYLATQIRHFTDFVDRDKACKILELNEDARKNLLTIVTNYFEIRKKHLEALDVDALSKRLIREKEVDRIKKWIKVAIDDWYELACTCGTEYDLVFANKSLVARRPQKELYVDVEEYIENIHSYKWQVPMSLRSIEPAASIKIKLK